MTMTIDEIVERLQPVLLLEGDSMKPWIKSEVQDSVDLVINYVNKASLDNDPGFIPYKELPRELYWIIKKMVQVAFNRQRSEGVRSHTEGGETLSWGDNGYDPLEPFIDALNEFIDGSSKRNSWDFW